MTAMHAVQVLASGGPEVLHYTRTAIPVASEGQALVRLEAIGVNYIDVAQRYGAYRLTLPFILGSEGAGVIESVGDNNEGFRPGDRVGVLLTLGTYANYIAAPCGMLIPLPTTIDSRVAAATLMQGLTAHYLSSSTYPISDGSTALVHAAAGGVGGLLVQMAKARGARVLATVSSLKQSIPLEDGADCVIDYTKDDFYARTMNETAQQGVEVVYDSVGRDTFERSLKCVTTRGLLVVYGQSSGAVEPFDSLRLAKRGIYLTRPSLAQYLRSRSEMLWRASEMFAAIAAGTLRVRISLELPLCDAAEVHRQLEGRLTTGKVLLYPPGV